MPHIDQRADAALARLLMDAGYVGDNVPPAGLPRWQYAWLFRASWPTDEASDDEVRELARLEPHDIELLVVNSTARLHSAIAAVSRE